MQIGNFRGIPHNSERTVGVPSPSAVEVTAEVERQQATQQPTEDEEVPWEKLSPGERWERLIKEAGIDRAEAIGILDAVLDKGYYEEYVYLRGKRARLRTRTYEDHIRLQDALEFRRPTMKLSQEEMITRYNLAASLFEWNGEKFPHDTEEQFEALLKKIVKFPGPLFSLLSRELAKFDQKIMVIFSEGAPENF